eukprot:4177332-Prymnesium_polylepis.1
MLSTGEVRKTAIGHFSGSTEFEMVQVRAAWDRTATVGSHMCPTSAQQVNSIPVRQHFNYYYYPFDVQQLKLTIQVADANITNCEMREGAGMTDGSYPLAGQGLTPDN